MTESPRITGGFGERDLGEALPEQRRIDGPVMAKAACFHGEDTGMVVYCVLDFMDFDQPAVAALREAVREVSQAGEAHIHILTTHNHGADELPRLDVPKLCQCVRKAVSQALEAAEPLYLAFGKTEVPEQLNYRRRIQLEESRKDGNALSTTIFYGPAPENRFTAEPSIQAQLKCLRETGEMTYGGIPSGELGEGVERRMPPGDPELAVWKFTNAAGEVKGWFCRFAAHAICCNRRDHYSGDYPSYLRLELEKEGGIALFFNGPCGDVAPGMTDKKAGYERKLSRRLAELAKEAIQGASRCPLLEMADGMSEVPVLVREDFPQEGEEPVSLGKAGVLGEMQVRSERTRLVATRAFLQSKIQTTGGDAPGVARLGLLRLNHVLLLSLPGETFWTSGQKIKKHARLLPGEELVTATEHERTLMYIVPQEECELGGYENTCRLVRPDFEAALVRAGIQLVGRG